MAITLWAFSSRWKAQGALSGSRQTWATLSRVEQLAVEWYLAKDVLVMRRVKRNKKRTLFLLVLLSDSHLFDVGLA